MVLRASLVALFVCLLADRVEGWSPPQNLSQRSFAIDQPTCSGDATSSTQTKLGSDWTRRDAMKGLIAPATLSFFLGQDPQDANARPELLAAPTPPASRPSAGQFFFPALTPPFSKRATFRYEYGRNMYGFEQLLTFGNVTATQRMTVVRHGKDLTVVSPLYPTAELCRLLDELGGRVTTIVLPCNALEHKAPMASFVKAYPKAKVFVAPGQYGLLGSTPNNMGFSYNGVLNGAVNPLPDGFEYKTLLIDRPGNAGPVSEVALWYRPSRTLILTDALVYIPSTLVSPDSFRSYFGDARLNEPFFWERTVLQAVFLPLRFENDRYPGFDAIANRLLRAPILRGFNDARGRDEAVEWIDGIVNKWQFDRIVLSHFVSPVAATPRDVRDAFGYLYGETNDVLPPIACRDWELLDSLNGVIDQYKLGAPVTFDYKQDCVS